jgi:4-hydroxy-tetrahydrodipicolinate synthase
VLQAGLAGVIVPLVTPLTADGQLDEPALERLLAMQLEAGVDAVFVLGSSGEGPMLPLGICREVVRRTVDLVAGRLPVLVGVSDCSTANVLARLRQAAEWGADAGVATLPFYGWADYPAGAVAFFTGLGDASPLPVIPYNLPMRVHVSMSPDTMRALYGHPNLPGIKDTNSDVAAMEAIAADPQRPASFAYLPGNTGQAIHLMGLGAEGFVPSPANVMPAACVAMVAAFRAGQLERADYLGRCMNELNAILKLPSTPGGLKIALELMGICSRTVAHPWQQASSVEQQAVAAIVARVETMLASCPAS